jgi:hypothetical protein
MPASEVTVAQVLNQELPGMMRELISTARVHVQNIVASGADIYRPAPPPPPPAPVEDHTLLYVHQNSKWRELSGEVHTAVRWGQASVPSRLAASIVAANLADYWDAPRARSLLELHGVQHGRVLPRDCIDLDRVGERDEKGTDSTPGAAAPATLGETVGEARAGTAVAG